MKFANNANHFKSRSDEGENGSSAGGQGSGRGVTGNGSHHHHHHIGRHGRAGGHASLFDKEGPFPNAARSPRTGGTLDRKLSPRSHTPRTPHFLRTPGTSKSNGAAVYDLEADDERTPLITNAKSLRTRNSRRPILRNEDEDDGYDKYRNPWKRMSCCIVAGLLVSMFVAVIIAALVLCSQRLMGVRIQAIQNVLAADQEIIFDLHVEAVNPNLVAIQVNDLDIIVHAKSRFVGTSKFWRGGAALTAEASTNITGIQARGNVDEGTDPIDDDDHVMTLGKIVSFDSPLIFDASPFRHAYSSSIGEVRLAKPGNGSEAGGSDRWETVIQHNFELIVRGVIKYTVPISSHVRRDTISGRVMVEPDDPVDNSDEDGEVKISKARRWRARTLSMRIGA